MPRSLLRLRGRAVGVAMLLLSMTACVRVKTYSALRPPIQLAAPSGLQLLYPAASGEPIVACTVLGVQGLLEDIRGDTLRISGVQPGRLPPFAPACPAMQEAIIVISNHPDLEAPGIRREADRPALDKVFRKLLVLEVVALVAYGMLRALASGT